MLTLFTGKGNKDCSGVSRRDFLQIGSLGVGTLTLANMLELQAHARSATSSATSNNNFIRDKAVVVLYLSGGASHIETFNPNMDAPSPYRSVTDDVKTSLPGVAFGGTFPRLAKWAHKMAIVRSFSHPIGGHEQAHLHVLSGGTDQKGTGKEGYAMGSVYARLRGASHPDSGLPTNMLLTHQEIDGQYIKEIKRVIKGTRPGTLGPNYAPFNHHEDAGNTSSNSKRRSKSKSNNSQGKAPNSMAADMELNIEQNRFDDRRGLLQKLDRLRRDIESKGNLQSADKYQQQAFELVMGKASKAFDVNAENPQLIKKYDTSDIMIGKKLFRPSNLGKQFLMTRRLIEAGAGFITIHSAGWDMHADGNNPPMVKGMNMLGTSMDRAVSTFLQDIKDRGLSDKVLLVITGDFGRTPKLNSKGGRDHWANLGPLAFAGGGLNMGQVIGKSDRNNGFPATEPITPQMMMTTIMQTLFDPGILRLQSGLPSEFVKLVADQKPIKELI